MKQLDIQTNGTCDAAARPCDVLLYPTDEKYSEEIRNFQGCPTLAVTRGGRIFIGWYSGGDREPHIDNYNLLVYSDDDGRTFHKYPILVIPSDRKRLVQALDIQLWTSPEGRLYVYWVQNDVTLPEGVSRDGYEPEQCKFEDKRHTEWVIICDDPDADTLSFSKPRLCDIGFLRCKPLVTQSGRWINFNYDQLTDSYGYSISDDKGKTWVRMYGAKKLKVWFDEGMAYQKADGSIRMLARCSLGEMAETTSYDDGMTWEEARPSGIVAPDSRHWIARTPTGRILLINSDHPTSRTRMTAQLSEDDGVTWKYKACFDERCGISYPDADFHNGKIYLAYDHGRNDHREIYFLCFTEEDIINNTMPTPVLISKPLTCKGGDA